MATNVKASAVPNISVMISKSPMMWDGDLCITSVASKANSTLGFVRCNPCICGHKTKGAAYKSAMLLRELWSMPVLYRTPTPSAAVTPLGKSRGVQQDGPCCIAVHAGLRSKTQHNVLEVEELDWPSPQSRGKGKVILFHKFGYSAEGRFQLQACSSNREPEEELPVPPDQLLVFRLALSQDPELATDLPLHHP